MSGQSSVLGRSLSDATLRMHQAIAQKVGLSGTDHKSLGILLRHGPMTAGALGRLTGLTTGAITGLVDRLEAKKLVARQADADDRRKVLIIPHTAKIQKLLGPTSAEIEKRVLGKVANMPKREVEIVERYLREMILILDELATKFLTEAHLARDTQEKRALPRNKQTTRKTRGAARPLEIRTDTSALPTSRPPQRKTGR